MKDVMKRKQFFKNVFGASLLISMDGFSTLANAMSNINQEQQTSSEFASYGAIHLNISNLERSTKFWTTIVGMKLRNQSAKTAEFGTEKATIVVLHETAQTSFQKGYSGLYHFAIHAPNKVEFASMVNRLIMNNYPFSPVDHTMSKSAYLDDPDGINVEFTLETPERFKRVVTDRGLQIEDSEGNIKSASAYLDVNEVLKELENKDQNTVIHQDTYLGHLHLYANNVQNSNTFYKKLGFIDFNFLPQFMYADLGVGGAYKHRIAMNSWHGTNKPLAPSESAGMRYFQINIKDKVKFDKALANISEIEKAENGYWCFDPTGNKILLTNT
jgi:catechol 2,3-dioxygenase